MRTFIVNLDGAEERWNSIEEQAQREGLDFERMPAILGKSLSEEQLALHYNPSKANWRRARDLTPAEIGCALSHLRIYREIELRDLPYALILEDDVVLPSGIACLSEKLADLIPDDVPAVCLLSEAETNKNDKSVQVDRGYCLETFEAGFFTSSYCLNRAAASYLLAHLHPVGDVADCWDRLKQTGALHLTALTPPAIMQNQVAFGSATTQDIQTAFNSSRFSKWRYRLRRLRNIALGGFLEARWRKRAIAANCQLKDHPIDRLAENR